MMGESLFTLVIKKTCLYLQNKKWVLGNHEYILTQVHEKIDYFITIDLIPFVPLNTLPNSLQRPHKISTFSSPIMKCRLTVIGVCIYRAQRWVAKGTLAMCSMQQTKLIKEYYEDRCKNWQDAISYRFIKDEILAACIDLQITNRFRMGFEK